MTTIPSQQTFAVGQRLTASALNDDLRDAVNFLLSGWPRAQVYHSADITCTTSTQTLMTFDTESYDTDSLHSTTTNNSRVAFNNTGLWQITYYVQFASNSSGRREAMLRLNAGGSSGGGSLVDRVFAAPASGDRTMIGATIERQMSAGDYVELFAWQNSGGNLAAEGGNNLTGITARMVSA